MQSRTCGTFALLEATSFLALLVGTFVRYSADAPVGDQILGPTHGVLFLAYVFMALTIRPEAGWSTRSEYASFDGSQASLGDGRSRVLYVEIAS